MNPNDAGSIKAAYPGYAGWNDPNAIVADFKATGGAGKGGSASGGGGSNVDINSLANASSFANSLNSGENQAYGNYLSAAQSMPKPLDIYNTLESQNGIPQLRTTSSNLQGQVNDLTDTINRVEPTVNATTGNSLVTEGQRQNMITNQKYPLEQQLTPLANDLRNVQETLSTAEQGINQQVGYAVQGNQQTLDALKTGISVAQDEAARAMSGYTADMEAKLNYYLEQMREGNALTIEQMKEASDLAIAEKGYANNLQVAQINNRFKEYGYLGGVVDTQNGGTVGGGGGGSPFSDLGGGSSGGGSYNVPAVNGSTVPLYTSGSSFTTPTTNSGGGPANTGANYNFSPTPGTTSQPLGTTEMVGNVSVPTVTNTSGINVGALPLSTSNYGLSSFNNPYGLSLAGGY